MKDFIYSKSYKIIYWGCGFDSLTELKFALSIQDEYEFLRGHIPIYFDPKTRIPTNYIRENIRRYTPDFVIRHKKSGEAFVIEIKPRAFENHPQLQQRKEVVENYIKWKQYDWKFKVVFDDQIFLNPAQRRQFHESLGLIKSSQWKMRFKKLNDSFDRSQPSIFIPPSNHTVRFVMFGQKK